MCNGTFLRQWHNPFESRICLVLILLILVVFMSACSPPPASPCTNFDDQVDGTIYQVNDTFTSGGVNMEVEEFEKSDGSTISGVITIELWNGAKWVCLHGVNLLFDFDGAIDGLSLQVAYDNSTILSVEINGETRHYTDPLAVDGEVIGGVLIHVTDDGDSKATFSLHGDVVSFSIGGDDVLINQVCPGDKLANPPCSGFESLSAGAMFNVGDTFSDGGSTFLVESFPGGGGSPSSSGTIQVDTRGNSGGSGNELEFNNANLSMDFGLPVTHLTLQFGAYNPHLNFNVNGVFLDHELEALGYTLRIGSVTVTTTGGVNDVGTLELDGFISSFSFGGEELLIDDVCPSFD